MSAWLLILLLLVLPRAAWAELQVHFIDVGQGDAILLTAPDAAVLVDAGEANGAVLNYLNDKGVAALDLIVATHGHADHIGGFTQVLPAIPVGAVWYNGQTHTTVTFERFIDAVAESGARYHEPVRGEAARLGELVIEVLHPEASAADAEGHLHDHNIVLRAVYGEVGFLLTGDLEAAVELELVDAGLDLAAQVLKLGHHGSRTSTAPAFVAAVAPDIAIYQAAANSRYGHPHPETLQTLHRAGVAVYGSPSHGTIMILTKGSGWSIATEREPLPDALAAACIDLNAAPMHELQRIVHVGPARAEAIVAQRPWASVEALGRIDGIGGGRLADIKAQGKACVGSP